MDPMLCKTVFPQIGSSLLFVKLLMPLTLHAVALTEMRDADGILEMLLSHSD